MKHAYAVLAVLLLAVGCGGGARDDGAVQSSEQGLGIVCSAEDPCGKGYICLSGVRCAKTCNDTSDCPTGQTCSGGLKGKRYCQ